MYCPDHYPDDVSEVGSPLRVSTLVVGLGLGAATVLATSLGWIAVVVVALPTVVVSIRAGRLDTLSGFLMGVGLVWSLLIARLLAGGATQDNAGAWIAVGPVPLVAGLMLLVLAMRVARARPASAPR